MTRHRYGQLPATPFSRLSSLTMHRLSRHVSDGEVTIPDEVKTQVGGLTLEQFKTHWPAVFDKIGGTAVDGYKATLPKVPEKYEGVKLPEGSPLSATVLEKVTTAARELGLVSNEHVQRLVDLTDGEVRALTNKIAADYSPGGAVHETQRRQYEAAALAAPDLGNGSSEALQAKVARVTTFTAKYFPDDVRKLFVDTGIGSHPNFFRTMLKIADLMKEDGVITGPGNKAGKSAAEKIYG